MFFYYVPHAIRFGVVGGSFVHHRGCSVNQRSVDHVTVSSHPTYIRRAPVDVVLAQVEHVLASKICTDEVSTCGMHNSLGFSSRSRSVQDVEQVFAVELRGFTHRRLRFH